MIGLLLTPAAVFAALLAFLALATLAGIIEFALTGRGRILRWVGRVWRS